GAGARRLTGEVPARVVRADDLDRAGEGGVGDQVVDDGPVAVRAHYLHTRVPGCVERRPQLLVPADVVAALVPAAEVVDGQPVRLRAVQPRDDVVDRVGGPERAADPARRAP